MKWIFADASYWVGLINQRDQLHEKIVAIAPQLRSARMLTSEMVLAEVLNRFSEEPYLRVKAAGAVEKICEAGNTRIVPQTAEQFAKALRLYKKSADKEWSLTDCASFLIMEELGIREALTYDQHFVQAGFKALLR